MLHPRRSHWASSLPVRRLAPPALAARLLAPITLAAALSSCRESEPPALTWPSGTVLAMNGVPIQVEEVDEVASWIAMVDPRFTLPHLRRVALTNVIFPKIAARGIDPERLRESATKAAAWRDTLETGSVATGDAEAPVEREVEGNYRALGMEVWRVALDLEPGKWSPVIESAGAFHIVKVVDRGDATVPGRLVMTLRMFDFPYLDPPASDVVNEALDRSTLVFVDESWRDFVPTLWQYRMHNRSP